MMRADKSSSDHDSAWAVSKAVGERRLPVWTVLVVAVASALTAVWIGVLIWAAAGAVGGLFG